MKTAKEVLDAIIIGMPDEDNMKRFIIMAMEEYAKLYHEHQLVDFLKHIKEVHTDEYGQLQICDNGDEYDPTVERVVKDYMKKSKNTISDWLDKYGDPEIDKKVEEELKHVITLDDTKIIKTEPRYLCEACFKQKCNCNKTFKRFINWIKGIRTKLYS